MEAQIVAVADAYAAMTADRSYRPGMSTEDAIAELRRNAGSQFLPEVVEAFATRADKSGGEAYEAARSQG